jgi:hypothetical protein
LDDPVVSVLVAGGAALGIEFWSGRSFAGLVAVVLGGDASSADAMPAWKHNKENAIATVLMGFIVIFPRLGGSDAAFVDGQRPRGQFVPTQVVFCETTPVVARSILAALEPDSRVSYDGYFPC